MSAIFGTVANFWDELVGRTGGPFGIRFILQPLVASALAIRDGVKDARKARRPFFWTILRDPTRRRERVEEGLKAISRVIVLAAVIDIVYGVVVFGGLRPVQTATIVLVLAIIPYFFVRGPAARIARRWMARPSPREHPKPSSASPVLAAGANPGAVSVELSSRRTGMSFQRTRMSADRTLMSVIRTALSLISFGFTIFQFFAHLQGKELLSGGTHAARNFGSALVFLGVAMLIIGIVYHLKFMLGLRYTRSELTEEGLIHSQSQFPVSFTLVVAVLLLFIGLAAIASVAFRAGPFG
ncbi:MAG TPA: DUF202 domain-containing protein [Rhizomicrobium sp.]|nr:DUF202 domain-containing protein [Rhizomicrobium sp.]